MTNTVKMEQLAAALEAHVVLTAYLRDILRIQDPIKRLAAHAEFYEYLARALEEEAA
jgi:hypothetical protein